MKHRTPVPKTPRKPRKQDKRLDDNPRCPECGGPGRKCSKYLGVWRYTCKSCGNRFTDGGAAVHEGDGDANPRCPQCQGSTVKCGFHDGERMYRCGACRKRFDRLGAPLKRKTQENSNPRCPKCQGISVKWGRHNGNWLYKCKSCGHTHGSYLLRETRERLAREHPPCLQCGGPTTKAGGSRNGRRRFQCNACGISFTEGMTMTWAQALDEKAKLNPRCVKCGGLSVIGKTYKGTQYYNCRECGKSFKVVTEPGRPQHAPRPKRTKMPKRLVSNMLT